MSPFNFAGQKIEPTRPEPEQPTVTPATREGRVLTRTVGITVDNQLDRMLAQIEVHLSSNLDVDVELDRSEFEDIFNNLCDIVEDQVIYAQEEAEDEEEGYLW